MVSTSERLRADAWSDGWEYAIDDWLRCAPFLQPALDRDPSHTLGDIWELLNNGSHRTHFWPGENAACVTQIVTNPRQTDLHIWLAGGDMAELIRRLPDLEAFAKASGCTRVTTFARQGFQRVLAREGYGLQFVALSKDLADVQ